MATPHSPLLLAVSDGHCSSPSLSPFENKLGGFPDFFPEVVLSVPPSCSSCNGFMLHLLQAYCPLEGSPYHRLLHIFCCSQPSCWSHKSGWLVLRSQKRDTPSQLEAGEGPPVNTSIGYEWCDDAHDWGTETNEELLHGTLPLSSDISTVTDSFDQLNISGADQINTVSVNTTTNPYYHSNGDSLCYPSYYISVLPVSELIINEVSSSDSREIELMEAYYKENPQWQEERGEGGGGGEGYERVTDVHRRFLKFKEEMTKCPQQLVRYQRGGQPLSLQDINEIPSCNHCGGPLVFELQLLPQIIYLLQEDLKFQDHVQGALRLPVVEYGTVLVFTCSSSCWKEGKNGFQTECTVIQQVDEEHMHY
ncbi:PREDICTED: programmed cell death protein 2-like [Amphimedon queenslandica]|uniref:Programmed cell death protein 2 C-terminal domain-containing protein n=1 Tax=Amphimedon queenslandica TaxID=400682 RepID=A0A1X7VBR2_AMPQE|nr:PREDICTED: programmed cell death protein 2-like [Amphimedon queenslandica]|eukprot:XP_011402497.1 PREDICTED: programmed cell death protein 2-like [Amphimedon queenslandica]